MALPFPCHKWPCLPLPHLWLQLAAGAAPDSLHEVFAAASGEGGNSEARAAVERVVQLRGISQQQ